MIENTVAIAAIISGLTATVLHWFPWRKPLSRLQAYVLGTLSYLIPACLVLVDQKAYAAITTLLVCVCASGISVVGCYIYDAHQRAQDIIEAEQAENETLRKNLDD